MRCGMAESEGTYVVLLHAAGGTSLLANKARHLDDSLLGSVCSPAWRHAAVIRQLLERFAGSQNERQSRRNCLVPRMSKVGSGTVEAGSRDGTGTSSCEDVRKDFCTTACREPSVRQQEGLQDLGFERQFSAFVLGSLAAGKGFGYSGCSYRGSKKEGNGWLAAAWLPAGENLVH